MFTVRKTDIEENKPNPRLKDQELCFFSIINDDIFHKCREVLKAKTNLRVKVTNPMLLRLSMIRRFANQLRADNAGSL